MSAAVVLTFDNLGAASEIERGTWSGPVDHHPSVDVALPWLLDALDRHGLRGTFFVEGVNAERHPEAVRAIAARGHEVGQHAWAHERWGEVDGAAQSALLARSTAAFAVLGVETTGFRPPGGALDAPARARLRAAGLTWCSPAGGVTETVDGLATLPFRWPLVDAIYRYAPLSPLRERLALPALDAEATADRLLAELSSDPDPIASTLVLHPMLFATPAAMAAVDRLLAALARGSSGVVPGSTIASRLLAG